MTQLCFERYLLFDTSANISHLTK